MELDFDNRGNLMPYKRIEVSLEDFQRFFITKFEDKSDTRPKIFNHYLDYLKDFKKEVTPNFIQWINGSFVSNKLNPRDIDFVTLVDFETYESEEWLIENRFRRQNAKDYYGRIDAYVVKIYPKSHERYFVSEYDLVYWNNWFTETKKNRAKKKFDKGYVEIKFKEN